MTQTSAFHFESLVWDWPIAIYLFLIGISAGLVTLAVLLRRFYPQAGGADSTLLRTTLIVGPGAVILGLLILVFHLTRPWTFWKLMFHYSFTSVMSMGVMLFQLYMVECGLLRWRIAMAISATAAPDEMPEKRNSTGRIGLLRNGYDFSADSRKPV